jgi:hypothetical protein
MLASHAIEPPAAVQSAISMTPGSLATDANYFPPSAWSDSVVSQTNIDLDKVLASIFCDALTANNYLRNGGHPICSNHSGIKTTRLSKAQQSRLGWGIRRD